MVQGIDFLTRTGHITDDKRQEFILLSDVLGVSMLVIEINNKKPAEATASTVFGPFFVEGSPRFANGDDIANGAPGEPCFMQGRVLSITGEPIPDAHIEVWQADDKGFYDVQYKELSQARGRGHLYSDEEGRYSFWSVRPQAYPIPDDGPVGELMDAAKGTHPSRMADYTIASPSRICDCPQTLLEPTLLGQAAARRSRVRFDTEYLSLEQDADGVTATVRDRIGGSIYQIRARYLLGADGARSVIAKDIGLPMEGQMDIAGSMNIVFSADLSKYVAHRPGVLYWVLQPGSDIGGIGMQATLGPILTFGYLAAKHTAAQARR